MGKVVCLRSLVLRLECSPASIVLACCLTCVLLFPGAVNALDPNKRLTQYMHKSWRIEDGSLPAGMLSVAQTADGFLWFTSLSRRLYRFDGVEFVPWTITVNGKPLDHIMSVYADHAGGLWAIAEHEIVHLKAGAVTSHFVMQAQMRTENIAEAPDGSLWVLQAGYDLRAPLCQVTDHAVKCFGESDGIPLPTGGESLLADGKGGFWLGGQRAVVHWHGGKAEVYPIEALKSNSSDGVAALRFGSNGSLWVGLLPEGPGQGLGRLENGVFKSFITPGFDGSKLDVFAMTLDRDGSLWVGTIGNGLFRIRGKVVEHYGRTEGLSGDNVHAVFEDREGILWVTTANGIDSFRDPSVTTFSAADGLGEDEAVGVLASRDGSIWVANNGSLDHIVNGSVRSIRQANGLPGEQVTAMLEDRAGNLWIAVGNGLYIFKYGRFQRIPEPDHQPFGLVLAMAEDSQGDIWAECSGKSRRLIRLRKFQVREQFEIPQVPMGRIAPDPQGGIWIGPRNGDGSLVLLRDGIQKKFLIGLSAGLSTNYLTVQADGSVLASFDDGLIGLRQGKTQRMTTKNGLPCNTVFSFIEDKEKRWWLLAECGIIEFSDSELQRWWSNPETVLQTRLYDGLDGARPARFGINPAALSPDGRVWFATGFVVQMVDPSRLSQRALPAVAYIESVTVDRKEFPAIGNLNLSPHPRDLQIAYTSPTFLMPQKVKFRYRLQGYDPDWHDAGTRRQAFYTDLPPGQYSFRVMACNHEGIWNSNAAQLDFYIPPAYYQTNWFRTLCAVIFAAMLWFAYHLRVRSLAAQFNMRLDERVNERTRIARDLHDTLLQSFQGLLMRFQTVSRLLPGRPVEAKEQLDGAIEQAEDAIVEGRDAVQGLRVSTMERNDLAHAISTVGEELACAPNNAASTNFTVEVVGESRDLHPILRDEIYRIAAEALRNAFRHAEARHVEVEIRYGPQLFQLRVRDDGRGFNSDAAVPNEPHGHYGLHGMTERAAVAGGKLTVWSEIGAGTEVELQIPARTAYAHTLRRSWLSEKLVGKVQR